jgi:PKD repeat protein
MGLPIVWGFSFEVSGADMPGRTWCIVPIFVGLLTQWACAGVGGSSSPPVITEVMASPNPALQLGSTVDFDFTGEVEGKTGTSWTQTWETGDGTTKNVSIRDGDPHPRVTHVYTSPGTFTVRLTITNYENKSTSRDTTITVKNLTGRWAVGATGTFVDLVQSGTTLTGTFSAAPGSTISGALQQSHPRVMFTATHTVSGQPIATTFTSNDFSQAGDVIIGVLNGGGFTNTAAQLRRQ